VFDSVSFSVFFPWFDSDFVFDGPFSSICVLDLEVDEPFRGSCPLRLAGANGLSTNS
jgi:hypothetical protein